MNDTRYPEFFSDFLMFLDVLGAFPDFPANMTS